MESDIFRKNKIILIMALFSCFLWGSATPSIKIGYNLFSILPGDTYGKILFAGYRFLIASFMIFAFSYVIKNSWKLSKEDFLPLFILGVVQTTIQYVFFYIGVSNTTGIKGTILSSTGTFFSVMISHFIYVEDRINIRRIIGIIIGFAGVVILNLNGSRLDYGFKFTGEVFIIMSTLASAIGGIYTKIISKRIPAVILTGYQMLLGSIVLIIIGFMGKGSASISMTGSGTILLLYLAFISAAAFTMWSILLKYNSVGQISIYQFSIPVFGVLLSTIFLHEKFSGLNTLIAVILVCIGVIVINKKVPSSS
jgi:drug/metabolite transporter (DMT)-like permease